jgi:hypothetical protein
MIQWEYKVVTYERDINFPKPIPHPGTPEELAFLNEQSKDGWEHYFTYIGVMLYYFKRQITKDKYNLEEH